MTLFSVIIATRNWPSLFASALNSVIAQTCASLDIIVVNDGTDDDHLPAYEAIIEAAGRPIRFYSLIQRPRGHGQSYSLNFGVAQACCEYVCFLDDDDYWTDPDYLERARRAIESARVRLDLHMSNQAAYFQDKRKPGPIWIESLSERLEHAGRQPDATGLFQVSVEDLMTLKGFCHLNTLMVRRALYEEAGGMDEGIRWECDRDIYLRLIERAKVISYSPHCVSRHNIPDPAKGTSMTTTISELERRLFQLRVFDKAALFAKHPLIRAQGRLQKAYTLKRITETLVAKGDCATAAYYAFAALGAKPTFKWAAFSAWVSLRATFARVPASKSKASPAEGAPGRQAR